jgi:hypothetical protein
MTQAPKRKASLRGVGESKEFFTHDLAKRAPDGDYRLGISMAVVLDGHRRTSRRIHQIPPNRTHLVHVGRKYPVLVDAKNPKRVGIDWARFKKVDGKKVLRQIVARIAPVLEGAGYRKVT